MDSDRCVALLLWPRSPSADAHLPLNTVGVVSVCDSGTPSSAKCTTKGPHEKLGLYRLILLTSAPVTFGWSPAPFDDSKKAAKPELRTKVVYMTSTLGHATHPWTNISQPRATLVLVPVWLPVYLDRFGFKLVWKRGPGILGKPIGPPFTLSVVQRSDKTGSSGSERFRVEVNLCGHGQLVVGVNFITSEQVQAPGNNPRTRYAHIQAPSLGPLLFGDTKKIVRVDVTRGPPSTAYCLDFSLEGDDYTTLRDPAEKDRVRTSQPRRLRDICSKPPPVDSDLHLDKPSQASQVKAIKRPVLPPQHSYRGTLSTKAPTPKKAEAGPVSPTNARRPLPRAPTN
ncbi:hypothetical protein BV20DRAFT_77181 [Pilatotrama ljubarskyi]|nr:hypothetical protein BV20DRAFT_77181 [Pilatotrama ljubarskyi]